MKNLIDNMGLNKACPKECVCLTKPNKLVDAIKKHEIIYFGCDTFPISVSADSCPLNGP